MKHPRCFCRKCSVFCYDHKYVNRHCLQCYRSWKEVCKFISGIGKCKCKC